MYLPLQDKQKFLDEIDEAETIDNFSRYFFCFDHAFACYSFNAIEISEDNIEQP